ncbi:MAG: hypothetical protein R3A80_10160 [Bdellovibrionota bacterium]
MSLSTLNNGVWANVRLVFNKKKVTKIVLRDPSKEQVMRLIEEKKVELANESKAQVLQRRQDALVLLEESQRLDLSDFAVSKHEIFQGLEDSELRALFKHSFSIFKIVKTLHRKDHPGINRSPMNGEVLVKYWPEAARIHMQKVFGENTSHAKERDFQEMTLATIVAFADDMKNSNQIYAKKIGDLLEAYKEAMDYLAVKGEPEDLDSLLKVYVQPLKIEGVDDTDYMAIKTFYHRRNDGTYLEGQSWKEDFSWVDDKQGQLRAAILGILFRNISMVTDEKGNISSVKLSPAIKEYLSYNPIALRNMYGLIHLHVGGYALILEALGLESPR